MENPSICIPRIYNSVLRSDIHSAFKKLNVGKISRVDITYNAKTNASRAFIHFAYWHETSDSKRIKQLLIKGHNIKLVYKFPWFWKCYLSKIPKPRFV